MKAKAPKESCDPSPNILPIKCPIISSVSPNTDSANSLTGFPALLLDNDSDGSILPSTLNATNPASPTSVSPIGVACLLTI